MKQHIFRGLRFGITGLANTGIHTFVAYVCLNGFLSFGDGAKLRMGSVAANGIAFTVATVFSYLVNARWTFGVMITRQNFRRFLVVSLIGLVVAMLTAKFAELIGFSPMVGVLIVVFVLPVFNFLAHNFWTFH